LHIVPVDAAADGLSCASVKGVVTAAYENALRV